MLYRYYKPELIRYGKEGYTIIPCKDEAEATTVKQQMKKRGRCAQAGYVRNQEGKDIFFVLTKDKAKKTSQTS